MKSKDIRKIFNHGVNNFMITSLQYSGIKVSNNDLIFDNGKNQKMINITQLQQMILCQVLEMVMIFLMEKYQENMDT